MHGEYHVSAHVNMAFDEGYAGEGSYFGSGMSSSGDFNYSLAGTGETDLVNFGGYSNVKRDYRDGESSSHFAHTQVAGESTVGTEMNVVVSNDESNQESGSSGGGGGSYSGMDGWHASRRGKHAR